MVDYCHREGSVAFAPGGKRREEMNEAESGTLESCAHQPAGTHQRYQIRSPHSSSGMSSKRGVWVML